MGTSSSFKGKVGNALLPNDFNSDDDMLDEKLVMKIIKMMIRILQKIV